MKFLAFDVDFSAAIKIRTPYV